MPIKILLVDDHQILREGLRNVIEKNANLEVIGEATNGREALRLCEKQQPDVVIMDIAMEGLNGMEATRRITERFPGTKVITLSMHSNKQFVLGMFKAGAYGYVLKDCDSHELINAIHTVCVNQKYITPKLSDSVLNDLQSAVLTENTELTSREKEILQLIAEGKSSKEIAGILFVSSKTVDAHRKNIMDKLEMYSISELTKYAINTGLTSLND